MSLKAYQQNSWYPISDSYMWENLKKRAAAGERIRLRADMGGMNSMNMGGMGMMGGTMGGMGGMGGMNMGGMNMGMGGMGGASTPWYHARAQSLGEMAQTLNRHNIRLDMASIQNLRNLIRQRCPSGRIDIRQRDTVFKECLRVAGVPVGAKPTLVQALWRQFDFDQNNYLDETEFVVGLSLLTRGTPLQKLQLIFDSFDVNKDGRLDGPELSRLLQAMTNQPTEWCSRMVGMMLQGRRYMTKDMFAQFLHNSPPSPANRWWHQMRMAYNPMISGGNSMSMMGAVPVGVSTLDVMPSMTLGGGVMGMQPTLMGSTMGMVNSPAVMIQPTAYATGVQANPMFASRIY